MNKRILILSALVASNSYAAFNGQTQRGESTTLFTSPNGLVESCIIPQKIKASYFSKGDEEDEATLCGMDFYKDSLVCPKQNSTNPGILIGEMIAGVSKERAEANYCKGPNKDYVSVEAKFKQSISCSYTPSVLAYYQFSRLLDDAGRVPVAVIRTMDKREHQKQTHKALSYGLSGVIKTTWSTFASEHRKGTNDKLFDNSRQFVYGALSDNPKREERYTEVSGRGSYETRYQRFLQQKPFLNVANPASIERIAGSSFEKAVHTVVQMKDVSDMILLDTLFSQDDRIGNIHYKLAWYFIDEKGKVDRKTSKSKFGKSGWATPKEEQEKFGSKGGILVKEMLLKDNDCGVDVTKRSNMMRNISAIEKVRHMSGKTYSRFMAFAKQAKHPDTESWMKRELLFTDRDLKGHPRSFQSNLDRAVTVLKANCESGLLKLDLNVQDFVPGAQKMKVHCDGAIEK